MKDQKPYKPPRSPYEPKRLVLKPTLLPKMKMKIKSSYEA